MFRLMRDSIARYGESTPNHITKDNVVQLNRILRKEWVIRRRDVCFEQFSPGVISVVFNRDKYTAAADLHIMVSDTTVLMCLSACNHQKSLMMHSFTVRVHKTADLIASSEGGPRPDEADLPEERVASTDSMDEVVRKTLRVLQAVPV